MATIKKQSAKVIQDKQERAWQVENAMNTLKRAEEIRKDKKLMSEVRQSAQNVLKTISGSKTTTRRK